MRWMALSFPLVLLMDVIIFVNFTVWQRDAYYDIRQRQLDLQVNYAIDGATQDLLNRGTHINTDYTDWGNMQIEPELALNTYEAMLIRNFGWSDTEENRKYMEDYAIPFLVVADYDGYYVYYKQKNVTQLTRKDGSTIDNVTYDLIWTPKLPYSEHELRYDAAGREYDYNIFYNLGSTYYGTITKTPDSNTVQIKLDNILNDSMKARKKQTVADTITDACNSALYNGLYGNLQNKLYIPNEFTQWSDNNPIESVSVLTYALDPVLVATENNLSVASFSVSGAKIAEPTYYILYTHNGVNLYTEQENRESVEQSFNNGEKIIAIITSQIEAAQRGYYYDTRFLK